MINKAFNTGIRGNIKDMIRLIRMWLLLRYMDSTFSNLNSLTFKSGSLEHGLRREHIVYLYLKKKWYQTDPFDNALIRKNLPEGKKSIELTDLPDSAGKKIVYYNSLMSMAIQRGYIKESEYDKHVVFLTGKAYSFVGFFPLFEKVLSEYKLSWTVLIIPLFIGVYGSSWLHHVWYIIFR